MSLLLDARKKSLQAQSVQAAESGQQNQAPETGDPARDAGHNLFAAKSLPRIAGYTLPNRNLLYALGGTILLLAAGAVYLWSLGSASNTTPLHPAGARPAASPAQIAPPVAQPAAPDNSAVAPPAYPAAQNALVPGITGPGASVIREPRPIATAPVANAIIETPQPYSRASAPQDNSPMQPNNPARSNNHPIQIEAQKTEPVDPLLMDAYLAYRGGKLGEARQRYLKMFEKDARNPDVLLGLAAIAQQQGENQAAAQYFGRVLALDPRNAAANAGMAALSADDDYNESRLKILLREQGNSTALHFALGNLYAGQSRWSEAQQAYFNASLLEPGNAEFAFNLAVSLDHLGQKKLAAQHYRRAMQLDASHGASFDHAQIAQRAQELAP